jgi:hypothetical protein
VVSRIEQTDESMSNWLHIRADGTIGLDERSREGLGGGPGPVALVGDLSLLDFSDLLSLVVHARLSGVLRVATGCGDRTLTFDDGELRGVTSSRVGERLCEVMVRLGQLQAEVMEDLIERSVPGRRIGRIVVEQGLISERDLWDAIQEQVTSIFQAIMLAPEGVFSFSEGSVADTVTVPGLSVEMLLMEGMRRIDELKAASPVELRRKLERIVAGYNEAFREIFATAAEAGSGEALTRASRSVFAGDASQGAHFEGIAFSAAGELPVAAFLECFEAIASDGDPVTLLSDILSEAVLFLLFVTGEHLNPEIQHWLHARAKAAIAAHDAQRFA